jgi:hypothetical protein
MTFDTIFDLLVSGLLIATLVYMIRLNRRLELLRSARTEFEALIARFVASTSQAEQSMAELKLTATERGQAVQEAVQRATALRDDLALLVDRGSRLADQLETGIAKARTATKAVPAPAQASRQAPAPLAAPQDDQPKPRSREERELLKALSSIR